MRIGTLMLSVLTVLAPTAGTISAVQSPATAAPAVHSSVHPNQQSLNHLVDLIVQRLELADTVAAAKWGTHGAIDDPAREQVVLDAAAAGAIQRGLDPDVVKLLFRDQIEASKTVQYGLFSEWSAAPEDAPTTIPDLSKIRPILDQITVGLLDGMADTHQIRTGSWCGPELFLQRTRVQLTHHLDALHQRALGRALRSVCS